MRILKILILVFTGLTFCICSACGSEGIPIETGEILETATDQGESPDREMETETEVADIYVYVCGAVVSPGVSRMTLGERIFLALERAGGPLDTADLSAVNLAAAAEDGDKIYIPVVGEIPGVLETGNGETEGSGDRVNINRASKDVLMTLPGIGEKKAEAILAYRESVGTFESPEDLMKVAGIKEGLYEKIKDLIDIN